MLIIIINMWKRKNLIVFKVNVFLYEKSFIFLFQIRLKNITLEFMIEVINFD